MAAQNPFGVTRRLEHRSVATQVVELPAVTVTIVGGPEAGVRRTFATPSLRIGTASDNDLIVADDSVSRYHARITHVAEGLLVTDLGSTNGTFIRGVRTREGFAEPGSPVRLGQTVVELTLKTETYHASPVDEDRLGPMIGRSRPMRELYALVRAVAETPATVLVEAESGCGKELVARTIHDLSRRKGPLVVFDCAATSADLLPSELFGHVQGAFTGAERSREGAFRRAHAGTLFIDELGELPLSLQPALLRALETREVKPVGADEACAVNVRLVAATNRDLESDVRAGRFREDLYHRLAVIPVCIPPLRERSSDIPLIVKHLVDRLELSVTFSADAMERLVEHAWPGNVRALRNLVERIGILCRGREVQAADLGLPRVALAPAASTTRLDDVEKQTILGALEKAKGNKSKAARILGIGLTTLKRRLKDYGVGTDED